MRVIRWLLNVQPLWNTEDEFNIALRLLPPASQTKIRAYHHHRDRKLALGSQLLQRYLIAKARHVPFKSIVIARDGNLAGGRPIFLGHVNGMATNVAGLEYNVSHHGSIVAIVSNLQQPKTIDDTETLFEGSIGVDVVYAKQRPHYIQAGVDSVMEYVDGFGPGEGDVFTKFEMDVIRGNGVLAAATTEEQILKRLFLHWSLKEAFVKAQGTGLVTDLLSVEFRNLEGLDMVTPCRVVLHGDDTITLVPERYTDVEVYLGSGREKKCVNDEWVVHVDRILALGSADEGVQGEEEYWLAVVARKEELVDGHQAGDGDGDITREARWKWIMLDDVLDVAEK